VDGTISSITDTLQLEKENIQAEQTLRKSSTKVKLLGRWCNDLWRQQTKQGLWAQQGLK